MRRLLWLLLLVVMMTCAERAKAQPPAAGAVRSGQTQVQNATNGNCLYNNAGVLGDKSCGGGGGISACPGGAAGNVVLYGTSSTTVCDLLLNWQAAPPGGGNEGGSLIIGSVAAKNAIPAIASLGGINVLGDEDTSTYNLLYINMVGGPASDFTYPVHQFFSFDGTLAAKTALSTGERIGGTVYNGYDGTGFTSGITTQVEVNGSVTTGNVPMDWVVYGGPNSNTEVFRLKGAVTGSVSAAICWKTTTTLSYCESVVGAGGTCTCH